MRKMSLLWTAALVWTSTGGSSAFGAAAVTRHPYPQSPGRDRVTLMWRTATPAVQTVDYGYTGSYNLSFTEGAATTAHEVTLTGLSPGREYSYRLREAGQVLLQDTELYRFKTDAGRGNTTFSFFVSGDIGEDDPTKAHQHYTDDMIRNITPRADFGLLCGDIVYPDGESALYDSVLMKPWANLLSNTAVWAALGNHDWHVDPDQNFVKEWSLPNNEHWYSFDWGNAHFVCLDTADGFLYSEAAQLAWLRADLTANLGKSTWTYVYYHHPILTCTYKSNIPALQAKLWPIFDEFKVDVVFNGHAHTYERLYPLRAGVPQNQNQNPRYTDPTGTIYIVSGCGGKINLAEPTTFCGPTAAFVDERVMFTQVFVYDKTMYIVTFDSINGQVMDMVQVTKTQGATDVEVLPVPSVLHQNVPNPFNPTTTVYFDVPKPGRVKLRVFRPDGSWVADLVDAVLAAGPQRATWNGRDRHGATVPSGVYLCRMDAEGGSWGIKMMLVR